jgi:hypothetical protein
VTVDYATADGTAKAPADYTATSGTLTFQPGETAKNVSVAVVGDTLVEGDETFGLILSGPVNATLAGGQQQATLTIADDDGKVRRRPGGRRARGAPPGAFAHLLIALTPSGTQGLTCVRSPYSA